MANYLLLELPGGNDTDVIEAMRRRGDAFVFVTADLAHYQSNASVWSQVSCAVHCLESRDFDLDALIEAIDTTGIELDGVLCLVDIRLIEAAMLAAHYGLPFLNADTACMIRDKATVRRQLANFGIPQPAFQLALTNEEVQRAVSKIGLPCLIKPSDGYGSQNIVLLRTPADLEPWISPLEDLLPSHADYGLGVKANDRLLVEAFMPGEVIGCDTITIDGKHHLLGVNEKVFFPPPSFAIEGGAFIPNEGQFTDIEATVFQILDALYFNHGAAHIELKRTGEGLRLVEVNARLVGAKIPRLMNMALGINVFDALLDIHRGRSIDLTPRDPQIAVSRWFTASQEGVLNAIDLPPEPMAGIQTVEILKQLGDHVRPPFENADRIGYVMACAQSQTLAEQAACAYLSQVVLQVTDSA